MVDTPLIRFFITVYQGNMEQEVGPTRLIEFSGVPADNLKYFRSRLLICHHCGRIWCKWKMEQQSFHDIDQWGSWHRACPDHPYGLWRGDTPGSMLMYHEDILVVPRPVLEYELMNLMEKS